MERSGDTLQKTNRKEDLAFSCMDLPWYGESQVQLKEHPSLYLFAPWSLPEYTG